MPLCPCGLNVRGLASTAAFGLMKASRRSFVIDGGSGLPLPLLQLRLGIEQIHLARAALHEHEDHVLRLGREMRLLGRQRVDLGQRGGASLARQQLGQRDRADAARALAEEAAADLDSLGIVRDP